jgi:vacuolar iron transporter family protein
MMRFELGLEKPELSRAWKSALTVALAYVVGGSLR